MNKPLLAASCLSFLTCAVHVFLGGPRIHDALMASDASDYARAVGSVVWHATSAILFINSLALIHAARNRAAARPVVWMVLAHYLAFAGLFLACGVVRFGSILVMMQWTAFLAVSLLALWGIARTGAIVEASVTAEKWCPRRDSSSRPQD